MLTVVARIVAKPEFRSNVREELIKLIKPTHIEEGCVDYILHEDNEDPNTFIFFENWDSEELLNKHLVSPHLTRYADVSKDWLADFHIHRMTKVA